MQVGEEVGEANAVTCVPGIQLNTHHRKVSSENLSGNLAVRTARAVPSIIFLTRVSETDIQARPFPTRGKSEYRAAKFLGVTVL